MEVINAQDGATMYTIAWLRDRVHFHLDSARSTGEVFLAEASDGEIVGHTIVRVEAGEGYFSTFYVAPSARRQNIATELVRTGEAWMRERGMTVARTNTATGNLKLQNLLSKFGYEIVVREGQMVSLTRTIA